MRVMQFNEELAIRLPRSLKRKLAGCAARRMLAQSDIAREAIAIYFRNLKAQEAARKNGGVNGAK
jgi:predicted transcriptional regulator